MMTQADHYDIYYADKLWNLLPATYRMLDSDQFGASGPLREMINRIGVQGAIIRRTIDRMWEDQSIETCDDWVIPYIGALLGTNLVAGLSARAQRLDVFNTIYYRRRKGTLGVLEEITADITGWDAKVVEFFRRLGRTRHSLDPMLADGRIAQAEGFTGRVTGTRIGGFADLRNIDGARQTGSAFDEFFHTADLRAAQGRSGWYQVPNIGVFVWRLLSFSVGPVTPVPVAGTPGWFTFDPTGRDIPLFGGRRPPDAYKAQWVSPQPADLPGPITHSILEASHGSLYPNHLSIRDAATGDILPFDTVRIRPERGQFEVGVSPPTGDVVATYCYGFPSAIGAGTYTRQTATAPNGAVTLSGGRALLATSGVVPPSGQLTISDSLTYAEAADLSVAGALTLCASIGQRPLIRLAEDAVWTITGSPGSSLLLEGLFVSGGDIVLAGTFASVTLRCCTFDPGSVAQTNDAFAIAADGRALRPTNLWITGSVESLTIDRCITAPVSVAASGSVSSLVAVDTIIQALPNLASPVATTAAVMLPDTQATLSRCTIIGAVVADALHASECILCGEVGVSDMQSGCVRYSAFAVGSRLPRQFASVAIRTDTALFTSTDFGQAGYCQLQPLADAAIVPTGAAAGPQNTISAGAEDGSEMGAYARDKNPIKARALLTKLQEFMAAELKPVLIYVT